MAKISFDFDGTLIYKDIQDTAKALIAAGHEVIILTTRYEDLSMYGGNVTHDELYRIAKDIGITQVIFTNYVWKYEVIDKYNIDIHIDDNYREEVAPINAKCKAVAIYSESPDLLTRINKILEKKNGNHNM